MRILHLTSHLGGGLGTVIMDWVKKENALYPDKHEVMCLDYANEKAQKWADDNDICLGWNKMEPLTRWFLYDAIIQADIVVLHFYDHPMIYELLSISLPASRMAFWAHKNYQVPVRYQAYPDAFFNTSLIQSKTQPYIWSTGDMSRFLSLRKKAHEGWNIGTIASPKLHPQFRDICEGIKKALPEARFTIVGPHNEDCIYPEYFNFVGKVDDVAPYLAEMDVFLYPLREGHWGTAEQALGEAMSAGVVPVVLNNPCEKHILGDNTGFIAYDERLEYVVEAIRCAREYGDSKACQQHARRLYDHDKMISQWGEVSLEMMKNPKTLKEPVAL